MSGQGNRGQRDNGFRNETNSASISRGRTRPNVPASCKFKTEMCHYLRELSHCPFSESCTYAHSEDELRAIDRHPRHRTQKCRDFTNQGYCPFGERCSFIHETETMDELIYSIYQSYLDLRKKFPDITVETTDDQYMIPFEIEDAELLRPPTASSGYSSNSVSPSVSPTPDAERSPRSVDDQNQLGKTPVTRRNLTNVSSLNGRPTEPDDEIRFGSLPKMLADPTRPF